MVKGNQPTLQRAIYDLIQAGCPRDPDHVEIDYGHGRIIKRSLWVADAEGLDFPHVKRAVRIRRDGYDVAGLPRANNDLERFFGSYRYHERRCSGRKVACPGTVVRGSVRLVAAG